MAVLMMLASLAHGGKLAEGYRGLAWGPHEVLAEPEGQCVKDPSSGTDGWACAGQTIGEVPVTVGYGYDHGLLYSVLIMAKGYAHCDTLMDTLTAAWGRSRPQNDYATGKLDARIWLDGSTSGVWKWNRFSEKCQVVMLHMPSYKAVEQLDAQEAKGGVDDL